jgi:hypothetical protein
MVRNDGVDCLLHRAWRVSEAILYAAQAAQRPEGQAGEAARACASGHHLPRAHRIYYERTEEDGATVFRWTGSRVNSIASHDAGPRSEW